MKDDRPKLKQLIDYAREDGRPKKALKLCGTEQYTVK